MLWFLQGVFHGVTNEHLVLLNYFGVNVADGEAPRQHVGKASRHTRAVVGWWCWARWRPMWGGKELAWRKKKQNLPPRSSVRMVRPNSHDMMSLSCGALLCSEWHKWTKYFDLFFWRKLGVWASMFYHRYSGGKPTILLIQTRIKLLVLELTWLSLFGPTPINYKLLKFRDKVSRHVV